MADLLSYIYEGKSYRQRVCVNEAGTVFKIRFEVTRFPEE